VFRYAAVLLLLSWPASAEVHLDYTFSQWEKLQDDDRTAYIASFIDTLRTMAATEPVCVPKIRFCNIGDEARQGQADGDIVRVRMRITLSTEWRWAIHPSSGFEAIRWVTFGVPSV
jgi:hypothetical protein